MSAAVFDHYALVKSTAEAIGVPVAALLEKMREQRRKRWLRGEYDAWEREYYGDDFEQEDTKP